VEAAVRRACALGVFIALALPAHALAADFYVDAATGDDSNGCTSPADACATIPHAAGVSTGTAGPNTVHVGPGTYTDSISLSVTDYDGLTIVGSGSGNNSASDTIISYSGAGSALSIGSPSPVVDGVTIEKLRVQVPSAAPAATNAVANFATNTTLKGVALTLENQSTSGYAFNSARGPVTFDHVTVSAFSASHAPLSFSAFDVTIRDSALSSPNASVITQTGDPATLYTTRIQRTSIHSSTGGGYALATNMVDLIVDSSLVAGGDAAVLFSAANGAVRHATLRNDTIDSAGFYSTYASAGGMGSEADIAIDSSIVLDSQNSMHGDGDGSATSVTCTWSDVQTQTQTVSGGNGTIDCPSDPLNLNHNSFTTTPSNLFVNLAGGDYHLAPTSPAIETGSPAALAGDESTTDLDGNPRVNDGNFDCVNARDKGAYEFVGTNTGTPVPQITAPASASPGTPVSFVGHATDEQPESALAFHWTFSDGGSATTQSATHTFAAPGTYQASLDVTDACGHVGHAVKTVAVLAAQGPPAPDTTGATISDVSMTHRVFAVGSLARKVPHGTRFLFTLSKPAAVKIVIEQPAKGRRVGSKCRRPSAKLRKKRSCTRYVRKGVLSATGVAGKNSVAFTGRLKRKALRPGKYRARITAKDAAGKPSKNQPKLSFRIVRG
jgi:hypothetical protein